ncbi:phosphatase PAP2 family protein [Streptomyces sp. TLI_171]|uniref:phosphatase PAP2 family protein n=1 Tax=Streptomyces sp. TLI_171 TaxID=1938859 RepID=UPI000C4698DF|nr:phosphatase PAP2 family protein [Streptomyces sp. TLI_171]RKE20755.1 undecaprenyl-diphosphatase [Streptomyces sp. TLI_171]
MHQPDDLRPRAVRSPVQRRRVLRCAWIALSGAALFAVLLVLVRTGWAPLARLDQGWVAALHRYSLRHPVWTAAMQTLADLGAPWVMRTLLGVVALWLWTLGARVLAGWLAAQALVAWLVSSAGRQLIGRARPHFGDPVAIGSGAAFPSGHAIASAVACGALLALVWPRADRPVRAVAGTAAAVTVLGVGWTRIALGVHWPSDVLAAWLAAAVVLTGVTLAVELWLPGRLGRDARLLRQRIRPRVQRVLAPPLPPLPSAESAADRDPRRS